jgi:hypothetical protein
MKRLRLGAGGIVVQFPVTQDAIDVRQNAFDFAGDVTI